MGFTYRRLIHSWYHHSILADYHNQYFHTCYSLPPQEHGSSKMISYIPGFSVHSTQLLLYPLLTPKNHFIYFFPIVTTTHFPGTLFAKYLSLVKFSGKCKIVRGNHKSHRGSIHHYNRENLT